MAKQSFKTAVGAFVIGGLALLVAGIILLGGGRMFSDDIEYVLYFDGSVSGLNIGAPVVFRGVPMGQVTRISLEANPRDASVTIPVYIRLDENSIVRAGVTGELTDNFRQEILRRYYDEAGGTGFDYAYRFPGMNKVLQAAGRVIRTQEDRGVVLLLDDRFARAEYTRLFPRHWHQLQYLRSTTELEQQLAAFWALNQ